MSVVEHPDEPRLQSFTVDDPRLWDVRPQLSFEELALEDVTDEEWDAFYAARGGVTEPQRASHVVIDTDVTSWLLDPRPLPYAQEARRVIGERLRILSFVTVTEMRYGALRAGWGELRLRRLERSLADFEVIQTNGPLINRCAELRSRASRDGHALAQTIHEADRWVAVTALVLGLELVAGDRIYEGVDGLDVHRIRPS